MEAEHTNPTPGPWYADARHAYTVAIVSPNRSLRVSHGNEHSGINNFPAIGLGGKPYAEFEANARLIAAAPDLYEALEALHATQNGPPLIRDEAEWRAAMDAAETAIAKARGQQVAP